MFVLLLCCGRKKNHERTNSMMMMKGKEINGFQFLINLSLFSASDLYARFHTSVGCGLGTSSLASHDIRVHGYQIIFHRERKNNARN